MKHPTITDSEFDQSHMLKIRALSVRLPPSSDGLSYNYDEIWQYNRAQTVATNMTGLQLRTHIDHQYTLNPLLKTPTNPESREEEQSYKDVLMYHLLAAKTLFHESTAPRVHARKRADARLLVPDHYTQASQLARVLNKPVLDIYCKTMNALVYEELLTNRQNHTLIVQHGRPLAEESRLVGMFPRNKALKRLIDEINNANRDHLLV